MKQCGWFSLCVSEGGAVCPKGICCPPFDGGKDNKDFLTGDEKGGGVELYVFRITSFCGLHFVAKTGVGSAKIYSACRNFCSARRNFCKHCRNFGNAYAFLHTVRECFSLRRLWCWVPFFCVWNPLRKFPGVFVLTKKSEKFCWKKKICIFAAPTKHRSDTAVGQMRSFSLRSEGRHACQAFKN